MVVYLALALFISAMVFTINGCNPDLQACYKYTIHNAVTQAQEVSRTPSLKYLAYIRFKYDGTYLVSNETIDDAIVVSGSLLYTGGKACHLWVDSNTGSDGFQRESAARKALDSISPIGGSIRILVDRTNPRRCIPYRYGYNNWLKGVILFVLSVLPCALSGYYLIHWLMFGSTLGPHEEADVDADGELSNRAERISYVEEGDIRTTAVRVGNCRSLVCATDATITVPPCGSDDESKVGVAVLV